MIPQPGDERAARRASRSRLRASQADREQVVDTLKEAFVQGRLTKDEFDSRVAHALAARTHADLGMLSADLPAMPPVARPPRRPVPVRPANPAVRNGARVIAATTVLTGGVWAGALLSQTESQALGGLVFAFTFLWFGIVMPFFAPSSRAHRPAQFTTNSQAIEPADVSTPATAPSPN